MKSKERAQQPSHLYICSSRHKQMIQNKLFWKLPHDIRRSVFKRARPAEYNKLKAYRTRETEKITGQSFKPFLDTNTLFVHIPKTAGIAIGHSIYGRHTGNHTTIAEYQMVFSKVEFDNMFKFTFVRNPWDRLLSAFLFLKAGGRNTGDKQWAETHLLNYTDFESFVLNGLNDEMVMEGIHFKPQHSFVTNPNSADVLVDFIGRFEHLEEDWKALTQNISAKTELKEVNVNRAKKDDFHLHYTDKMAEIVADVYQKDIAIFGYTF